MFFLRSTCAMVMMVAESCDNLLCMFCSELVDRFCWQAAQSNGGNSAMRRQRYWSAVPVGQVRALPLGFTNQHGESRDYDIILAFDIGSRDAQV
jgi:hypothetical protein